MSELQAAINRARAIKFPSGGPTLEDRIAALSARLTAVERDLAKIVNHSEETTSGERPTIEAIKILVCRSYGISLTDIISERRTAAATQPRQIAMYLARRLTTFSMPAIGRHFGNRDHSTVLCAVRKIAAARAAEPALDTKLRELESVLTTSSEQ